MDSRAGRSFLGIAGLVASAGCLFAAVAGCGGTGKEGTTGATGGAGSGATGGVGGGGATGGSGTGGSDPFGSDGYGKGDVAQAPCDGVVNAMGPVLDMPWPNPSNIGHDGPEGSSIHFHWSGSSHNVVQIAAWKDYWHPDASVSDPGFPREFNSGPKSDSGDLYLNYGAFPCGYRPGIYFFVDQDNAGGGIVSSVMTVAPDPSAQTADYYAPKPCSSLSDPKVYGGRYWAYASRPDCTVFEINNFQTEAHFDWMPDTFHKQQAKQGDLVLFRWTGFHNVVQVHDATQDLPIPGGIQSGPKKECVGGPNYSCANGPPIQGEYMIDTLDYRPGILHFSDENAIRDPKTQQCWNGGCTGMNQQFQLASTKPKEPMACCDLPGSSGKYSTSCHVIDVWNDGGGAQWNPYQTGAGGNDVVRFRWAGTIQISQVLPGTKTPKPDGFGMPAPVECVPGPHLTCLNGTTDQAEFLFDVAAEVAKKSYDQDMTWSLFAKGEVTPGFTSNDSGAIIYLTSQTDPNAPKCP